MPPTLKPLKIDALNLPGKRSAPKSRSFPGRIKCEGSVLHKQTVSETCNHTGSFCVVFPCLKSTLCIFLSLHRWSGETSHVLGLSRTESLCWALAYRRKTVLHAFVMCPFRSVTKGWNLLKAQRTGDEFSWALLDSLQIFLLAETT